ncbi:MAG: general secretion pathway protein GspB [Rubrivivax sp.]|nr:general secretion pathway protein GspB [Rubrivivax sp.]
MSYILDALRRAESERDRGQVPGLNAQAEAASLGEGPPPRAAGLGWMALGGVAFASVLVGFGWWIARPAQAPAGEAVAAGAASSRAASETAPRHAGGSPGAGATVGAPPAAGQAGPALLVAPAAPPQPRARTAASQAGAGAMAAPRGARTAADPLVPPVQRAAPASLPAPAAPQAAAPGVQRAAGGAAPAATGATPPVAAASAVPAARAGAPTPLADLAPALRAELPQLHIGGAIYSDQPTSRFVVINGLVVREGETAAPGVTLERVAPKSAVVRWREMRIELPL